jgi:hypothetical protein
MSRPLTQLLCLTTLTLGYLGFAGCDSSDSVPPGVAPGTEFIVIGIDTGPAMADKLESVKDAARALIKANPSKDIILVASMGGWSAAPHAHERLLERLKIWPDKVDVGTLLTSTLNDPWPSKDVHLLSGAAYLDQARLDEALRKAKKNKVRVHTYTEYAASAEAKKTLKAIADATGGTSK